MSKKEKSMERKIWEEDEEFVKQRIRDLEYQLKALKDGNFDVYYDICTGRRTLYFDNVSQNWYQKHLEDGKDISFVDSFKTEDEYMQHLDQKWKEELRRRAIEGDSGEGIRWWR